VTLITRPPEPAAGRKAPRTALRSDRKPVRFAVEGHVKHRMHNDSGSRPNGLTANWVDTSVRSADRLMLLAPRRNESWSPRGGARISPERLHHEPQVVPATASFRLSHA